MTDESYERSVFVNCPFDPDYKPLFEALLFTVIDLGFHLRTALDSQDSSQVRISKIYDVIASCRLAIHDLSRTEVTPASGLPRFNMPLEFGIFLGAKAFGSDDQRRKACLVFDSSQYRYQAYISDIAGQDIGIHGNDPRQLVVAVRNWLANVSDGPLLSGSFIWSRYQTFRAELPTACHQFRQDPDELTYRELVNQVDRFRLLKKESLEVEKGTSMQDPDPWAISKALRGLNFKNNTFAIYVRGGSGGTYIQTACDDEDEFVLEYQEGSLDHHYRCTNQYLSLDTVIQVFQRYARGDDDWKRELTWERLEL